MLGYAKRSPSCWAKYLSYMTYCDSLRRHRTSPKGTILDDRNEASKHRNGGRHHSGMMGEFISERWAASNRNGGRHHLGMMGAITSEYAVLGRTTTCAEFPGPSSCRKMRRGISWPSV